MEKDNQDKKNRIKDKPKYSYFVYNTIYAAAIKFYKILFKVKVNKALLKNVHEPVVYLNNHGSVLDFLFVGNILWPKKVVYLMAKHLLSNKNFKKLLKGSPYIARDQFVSDMKSIRDMKRVLDNNMSVLIYPEGKVSACGKMNYFPKSTGKMLKLFNKPVVVIKTNGSYSSMPNWSKNYKFGKVKIKVEKVLSIEDIKSMTVEQINTACKDALSYNDNLYQIENNHKFYGKKFAEGLHKLLYVCPNCNEEFTMDSTGKYLYCKNCGFKVKYCHNGELKPIDYKKDFELNRIDKWFDYQRELAKKEIENPNFKLIGQVDKFCDNKDYIFKKVSSGKLILTKEKLEYQPDDTEEATISAKCKNLPTLSYKVGERVTITDNHRIYHFYFNDKLMSTKYLLMVEEVYKRYYENWKEREKKEK